MYVVSSLKSFLLPSMTNLASDPLHKALYTIGLGLSFIFKSAASNAFDSVIWL